MPTPRPLRIAVEATRFRDEVRGIGRYVRAVVPRLAATPGIRLTLHARLRDLAALREEVAADGRTTDRVAVRHVAAMRLGAADVAWYPWNIVDPAPWRGPVVATIHDLAPLVVPNEGMSARTASRWRRRFEATARRASLVLADSAFTASEVQRVLGVAPERLRVVHLAADDLPVAPLDPEVDARTLERLGVRAPFVLAAGATEPRKNVGALLAAMPAVLARHPRSTLVLVGPGGGTTAGTAPWLRPIGFVTDAELQVLYRRAECLVMPSTYEGFGLPVLEAMRAGTPVVCARRASLPEVGGQAARWFDPSEPGALEAALCVVLTDDWERARLRAAGYEQAARFSWDDTARRTLEVLAEAAGRATPSAGARVVAD